MRPHLALCADAQFNQLMACLCLARVVKQAGAGRTIIFGGAACTEPMGSAILRAYPGIVDDVVSGFGEGPIRTLPSRASAA